MSELSERRVQDAVDRVIALKQVAKDTNILTFKSQATILKGLSDLELAEAALRIKQAGY